MTDNGFFNKYEYQVVSLQQCSSIANRKAMRNA